MLPQLLVLAYASASAIQDPSIVKREVGFDRNQLFNNYMANKIDLRRREIAKREGNSAESSAPASAPASAIAVSSLNATATVDTVSTSEPSGSDSGSDDDDDDDSDDDSDDDDDDDSPIPGITEPTNGVYVSVNHKDNSSRYPDEMFESQNTTCVLQPEADVGPYYIDATGVDDYISPGCGVSLDLSVEIYDINTCQVLENVLVDFWHADALGYYSGQGSSANDGVDTSYTSFCRGVYPDYGEGVVDVMTTFPGHASNRTNHISFMVRTLANGSDDSVRFDEYLDISTTKVVHVGEFYFDQDLIDAVEQNYPYSLNKRPRTLNQDDSMLKLMQGPSAPDPIVRYWFYDNSTDPHSIALDGIVAWISIGVNASASYEPFVAAQWANHNQDDEEPLVAVPNNSSSYEVPSYLTGSVAIPTSQPANATTRYVSHSTHSYTYYGLQNGQSQLIPGLTAALISVLMNFL